MRNILDSIDSNDYDDAFKKTKSVLKQDQKINEDTFRTGVKILYKLITKQCLTSPDVLIVIDLFNVWLGVCLGFKQNLVSKHTIIHYVITFIKDLIAKQHHESALHLIEIVQNQYEYNSNDLNNEEARKYLQYTANMCQTEANKIINGKLHNQVEYTFKYIQSQVELNLKLNPKQTPNDNLILQIVEQLTVYQSYLFKLLNANSTDTKFGKLIDFYKSIISIIANNVDKEYKLFTVVFNFYLSVATTLATSSGTSATASYIHGLTDAKRMLAETINNMATGNQLHFKSLVKTIVEYKHNLKFAKLTDELLKLESKLLDLFETCSESINQADKFQTLFFLNLIEFFYFEIHTFLNDSSYYGKYMKNCDKNLFLNLFVKLIRFHMNTCFCLTFENNLDLTKNNKFVFVKNTLYRLLNIFYAMEKIFEFYFKSNDLNRLKNAETNVKLCLSLCKNHDELLNWFKVENIFSNEELWKMYHNLENCGVKICSHFFSIESEFKEIDMFEYQKLVLNIAISKVSVQLKLPTANVDDTNLYKTLIFIGDNYMLTLRLVHKYEAAVDVIKTLYDFLVDNKLEYKQCEMLITNWCKIKRDASKLGVEQNNCMKRKTIDKCISINDGSLMILYLFEELRILKYFSSIDSNISLYDEIYFVIERLYEVLMLGGKHSLVAKDLDKIRLYIEFAQFFWVKQFCTVHFNAKMDELNSETCLDNAISILNKHKCATTTTTSDSDCLTNTRKQGKRQQQRSVLVAANSTTKCNCLNSKILDFELHLYKMLSKYADQRDSMCDSLRVLMKQRTKLKETQGNQNHEFNANFEQRQTSIQYLLCEKLISQSRSLSTDSNAMSSRDLVKLLDAALHKVKLIFSDLKLIQTLVNNHELYSIRKQFYSNLDLLANLYGFFCLPLRKQNVLGLKFDLLKMESLSNPDTLQVYVQTAINMMKLYLSLHRLQKLNDINSLLFNKTIDDYVDLMRPQTANNKDSFSFIDKHAYMQVPKCEFLLQYYIIVANYFLVKKNFASCVYMIKHKVLTSGVFTGRQTAPYYEVKYYLKYVMFMLTTLNFEKKEKCEQIMQSMSLTDETPLSLLEECYQAIFSVSKFYLQNSIEPSKLLNSNSNELSKYDNQTVYFNIGNADCYRILGDDLDIMQYLAKYYVELSRYREATCFIREGLDLTQLHNCEYRIIQFLLHQINTDLIAANYEDALDRLKAVEKLLKFELDEEDEHDGMIDETVDLVSIKNYMHLNLLKIVEHIKRSSAPKSLTTNMVGLAKQFENLNVNSNIETCFEKIFKIRKYLVKTNLLSFYNELFVEFYLNLWRVEIKSSSSNEAALGYLKMELLDNSKQFYIINEKWYLAQYYLLLYEQSAKQDRSYLKLAYEMIRLNPHPYIYRRICIYLFHDEVHNTKLKSTYLLETQSIALRHKSCSIQIKNKRKSQINLNLYENLNKFISFNTDLNDFYDSTLNRIIPKDYTIIAFVLIDSTTNAATVISTMGLTNSSALITPKADLNLLKRIGVQRVNKCLTDFGAKTLDSSDTKSKSTRKKPNNLTRRLNESDIIILNDENDDEMTVSGMKSEKTKKPDLHEKKIFLNMEPSPNTPEKTPTTNAKVANSDEITQDLYLIRIEKHTEPFIHKLNYNLKYLKQFKQIIQESDDSMKHSERVKFWQTRNQINQSLIHFLNELQDQVFSFAKYFLLGSLFDPNSNLPNAIPRAFQDEVNSVNEKLGLINSKSSLSSVVEEQQKQIIFYLLNSYEYLDRKLIKNAFKFANLNEKQFKLFVDYLAKSESKLRDLFANYKRKHICLLIDKYLHQIPWECLTILKQQCITRMPSIHFLLSHLQLSKLNLNRDSAFYIVDPGGDLAHTKEKFKIFFEQQKNWNGIIGHAPDEPEFKKALTEYDLFIYTGHGSGSQYYPSDEVQKLRVQACSILMGCSSGNQYVMGDFEPYGTILAYILAGCPCVVGNLWDVTDRDIDRLTESFLQSWLEKTEKTQNICEHLIKSRDACKMSHLNGSAPVIYGLPVYFNKN